MLACAGQPVPPPYCGHSVGAQRCRYHGARHNLRLTTVRQRWLRHRERYGLPKARLIRGGRVRVPEACARHGRTAGKYSNPAGQQETDGHVQGDVSCCWFLHRHHVAASTCRSIARPVDLSQPTWVCNRKDMGTEAARPTRAMATTGETGQARTGCGTKGPGQGGPGGIGGGPGKGGIGTSATSTASTSRSARLCSRLRRYYP